MLELTHADPFIPEPTRAASPEALWFIDSLVRIHVDGEETGRAFGLVEQWGPKGDMPPLHVHHEADETFHVVEGELSLFVGDRHVIAGAGQTVVAPRGIPHTYCVESAEAHWLVMASPSGFEAFVRAVAQPAEAEELPPRGRPLDPAALGAAAAEAGIEILGPPGALPSA